MLHWAVVMLICATISFCFADMVCSRMHGGEIISYTRKQGGLGDTAQADMRFLGSNML